MCSKSSFQPNPIQLPKRNILRCSASLHLGCYVQVRANNLNFNESELLQKWEKRRKDKPKYLNYKLDERMQQRSEWIFTSFHFVPIALCCVWLILKKRSSLGRWRGKKLLPSIAKAIRIWRNPQTFQLPHNHPFLSSSSFERCIARWKAGICIRDWLPVDFSK